MPAREQVELRSLLSDAHKCSVLTTSLFSFLSRGKKNTGSPSDDSDVERLLPVGGELGVPTTEALLGQTYTWAPLGRFVATLHEQMWPTDVELSTCDYKPHGFGSQVHWGSIPDSSPLAF